MTVALDKLSPHAIALRDPRYLSPNEKPAANIKPSSKRDLQNAWLFDDRGIVDLVTGTSATLSGATPVGDHVFFDESNDYATVSGFSLPDEWTLYIDLDLTDNDDGFFQYLISVGGFEAADSLNLYIAESTSAYNDDIRVATDTAIFSITDAYTLYDYTKVAVSFNATTNDLYLVLPDASASGTETGTIVSGSQTLYIGARSDLDSQRFLGGIIKSMVVERAALPVIDIQHTLNNFYNELFESSYNTPLMIPVAAAAGRAQINPLKGPIFMRSPI